jgi:heme exporter protein D
MSWASLDDFLHMGGYGLYVWGAYGVTLAALAFEALSLALKERSTLARLQRELGGESAR